MERYGVATIKINAPGAGEWIVKRAGGGVFHPGYAHSFSVHRKLPTSREDIVGGIVLSDSTGHCAVLHMAGEDKHWFTRDLAWLVFDYAFYQLGLAKLLGLVRSDNYHTLSIDLRAGFNVETLIRDMYAPGVHCFILSMTRETCPWLRHTPRGWRSNKIPEIFTASTGG